MMTMPTKTNCSHSGEGWCLNCVQAEIAAKNLRITELEAERDRLRDVLRDVLATFETNCDIMEGCDQDEAHYSQYPSWVAAQKLLGE